MALTISSCNTFHMLPGFPCSQNYCLNSEQRLKIKRASKTIVCTPVSRLLSPKHTQKNIVLTPLLPNSLTPESLLFDLLIVLFLC